MIAPAAVAAREAAPVPSAATPPGPNRPPPSLTALGEMRVGSVTARGNEARGARDDFGWPVNAGGSAGGVPPVAERARF